MRKTDFPRVSLDKGTLTVYGLYHDFDLRYRPPKEVRDRLGREASRFGPNEYFVVEGTPFIIGYNPDVSTRLDNRIINVLSQVPQLRRIPHIDNRTELAEWYFPTILWNPVDKKIFGFVEELEASLTSYELAPLRHLTIAEPEDVEVYKRTFVAELRGKIDDVSREELALHVEKRNTLRSLLLARIGYYRVDALGGNVRLFMGFMHAGEARRFLKNPDYTQRYLQAADEEIRTIYERNEEMQQQITAIYSGISNEFRLQERSLVLRHVAIRSFEDYMHRNTGAHAIVL